MPVAQLSPDLLSKTFPDLTDEKIRADMTPAATEAFVRLAEIWRLTAQQASALLGEGSSRTWFRIKGGERASTLSQDALTRISALIGVYKGLHLLFSEPLCDDWVRRENAEAVFHGLSPMNFMIAGGIPAMLETRRYIDALRGGL